MLANSGKKLSRFLVGDTGSSARSENENEDLSLFKILVAEDNLINQKILEKMLQRMNIRFHIVRDGPAVLEALQGEYFDLVLLDCYLPLMSGFETARIIRSSSQRFAKIPLIGFSAGLYDEELKLSRQVGMNDFLQKPATYEQLRAKINEWARWVFAELPVLEASALDRIRVFDDDHNTLLRSIFQIYSENTQNELSKLRDLIRDGNEDLIRKKAHMLKSSAAQLGALRFEKFCILLEHEELLDQDRALKLFEGMRGEYEKSRQKIFEYCQKFDQKDRVLL